MCAFPITSYNEHYNEQCHENPEQLYSPIRHYVTDHALFQLLMATEVCGLKQTHFFAHSLRSSPIAKT